jgi:hypothetical protein
MAHMKYEIGQKVICNGYPGTVIELCAGGLRGMIVVRLDPHSAVWVGGQNSPSIRPA